MDKILKIEAVSNYKDARREPRIKDYIVDIEGDQNPINKIWEPKTFPNLLPLYWAKIEHPNLPYPFNLKMESYSLTLVNELFNKPIRTLSNLKGGYKSKKKHKIKKNKTKKTTLKKY